MNNRDRFQRRMKGRVAKAYDGICIGVVDYSMNEHKEKKHKPYWYPHLHGVAITTGEKAMKKALKKVFPPSRRVPRPIKIKTWDGNADWLRYCHESDFERRISTDHGKRYDKKTSEQRQCRDTDKQPLKSKQKLELLKYLDDIGIAGRVFLRGVQFQNLKGIGPTFVDRR